MTEPRPHTDPCIIIPSRTGRILGNMPVRRGAPRVSPPLLAGLIGIAGLFPGAALVEGAAAAAVSVCFSPGPRSCATWIAALIDEARVSIRLQAYWLTSPPILRALMAAQKRGVDVQALLDRTQDRTNDPRGRYTPAVFLVHAGVRVWIDDALAIAHNKALIVDGARVVTGSFNFTKSADTRNAENAVLLDSSDVARWFTANWEALRAASRAFQAE